MSDMLHPVTVIRNIEIKDNTAISVMQSQKRVFNVESHFCGPFQYREQLINILKRNVAELL